MRVCGQKQNSILIRESTSKWRTAVGIGEGLFIERMWKMFLG